MTWPVKTAGYYVISKILLLRLLAKYCIDNTTTRRLKTVCHTSNLQCIPGDSKVLSSNGMTATTDK